MININYSKQMENIQQMENCAISTIMLLYILNNKINYSILIDLIKSDKINFFESCFVILFECI